MLFVVLFKIFWRWSVICLYEEVSFQWLNWILCNLRQDFFPYRGKIGVRMTFYNLAPTNKTKKIPRVFLITSRRFAFQKTKFFLIMELLFKGNKRPGERYMESQRRMHQLIPSENLVKPRNENGLFWSSVAMFPNEYSGVKVCINVNVAVKRALHWFSWNRGTEFKSWTRLSAIYLIVKSSGRAWIYFFSSP